MERSSEAPDDPSHDQSAHHIARQDMQFEHVLVGKGLGDGKGYDRGQWNSLTKGSHTKTSRGDAP